ncbi:hypothetical protein ACQYAD_04860 [Neobacillus sp. SM06]|uniref:hypothetical protein n=1 Tax=Neobacillus sp. SM06 TaxID=3422492 RepID=UPI003D26D998
MKSLLSFFILLVSFFSVFTIAEAHGGESTTALDAPTLIRQAIDISTGLQDPNGAMEKAQLALYAKGIDTVDKNKLNQAIALLKKSDLEQANKTLAEALKEDPQKSNLLEFKPGFKATGLNIFLIILAIGSALIGVLITRYAAKLPYKHKESLSDIKPVA